MALLSVFNFTTLNGFYKGVDGDISWHKHGKEEEEYSKEGLASDSILLFVRVTYDMMASWWPTPMAKQNLPEVAEGMNKADKIVFSKKLKKADWENTLIISGNIVDEIKKLKKTSKKDMTILGSGTIVTQFAEAGLIDVYQIMIDPVVIGTGTPIFNGIKKQLDLKLTDTRKFRSGVVLHTYQPAK